MQEIYQKAFDKTNQIQAITANQAGDFIVTAQQDGFVKFWKVEIANL